MVSESVLIESFKSARTEIAERIRLRDQTLAAYLAGVVSVVAFSLSQETKLEGVHGPDLLLFVPVLAFAAAKVLSDNHKMVGALALYQAVELAGFIGSNMPPLWERSEYLARVGTRWWGRLIDDVAITDTIAVVGPAVIALSLYRMAGHRDAPGRWHEFVFWADMLLLTWSGLLLWLAGLRRRRDRLSLRRATSKNIGRGEACSVFD